MVNNSKPTVALFGGSFDPPHLGHQNIVKKALQKLDVDAVLVVPAYLNPFKSFSLADATTRLNWSKKLFFEEEKVLVSSFEIDEARSVRTFESVRYFETSYEVKYIIIGSDNLEKIALWHDFEWLNKKVIWVVATRDGYELETDVLREYRVLEIDMPISSTDIRKTYDLTHIDSRIRLSVKKILEGAS